MTQQTNIANALTRLVTAANTLSAWIGTLGNLTTTDKSSLVAALNEVKASIPAAAAVINDAATATGTTWSSTKIQNQIAAAITAVVGGADSANDTLKEIADQIVAIAQADAGMVSAAGPQSFTNGQKLQACQNIGIGDPEHNFVTAIEAGLAAGL